MTETPPGSDVSVEPLTRANRRRHVTRGLLRAAASTVVLLILYFTMPLNRIESIPVGVSLLISLLILLGVVGWYLRAITRAPHPGVRAIEALAMTVPLFLILFAASYFFLSQDDPASFTSETMTRTDSLYFTITIFATVGFGDISPASQLARRLVMGQMVLDLIVLGAGVQLFLNAVQRGRQQ